MYLLTGKPSLSVIVTERKRFIIINLKVLFLIIRRYFNF